MSSACEGLFDYDKGLVKVLNAGSSEVKLVSLKELQPAIETMMRNPELVLQNQREAYMGLNEASILPIQTIGQPPMGPVLAGPEAQVCIKTGYMKGDEIFVAKVAGGGGKYSGNTGMLQIYSQKTLKLMKILCDEGILTEIRTAGATALASQLLMPEGVKNIGFFGCGIQAMWQLRFLNAIFKMRNGADSDLPTVHLKTRSMKSATNFIETMKTSACRLDSSWVIKPVEGDALKSCALIHTVTCNRGDPVLSSAELGHGSDVHISAVGTDSVGKRELDDDLLKIATLKVTDSRGQCFTKGEYQHLPDSSIRDSVLEIGDLLRKENFVRPAGITIFDTSGVAIQDVAIAKLASSLI